MPRFLKLVRNFDPTVDYHGFTFRSWPEYDSGAVPCSQSRSYLWYALVLSPRVVRLPLTAP